MPGIEFRASCFFALALIACGSSEPDFSHPDRGAAGSTAGGADPGGSGGTAQGGTGATPQGGAGAQAGGAGGSGAGGNAGDGSSGAAATGGTSGVGGVATGGSSGTGSTQFSCGPLRCFTNQQWCRVTKPPLSGGSTQYMCQPFPDSCSAYDCNCVCMHSPCESTAACLCATEGGGVTVTCGP